MSSGIRRFVLALVLAGIAAALSGCTFSKNDDNKGSIYKNPPAHSDQGSQNGG